jgi:hypothetical protein
VPFQIGVVAVEAINRVLYIFQEFFRL